MTLTDCLPVPGLVEPGWFDMLPDELRVEGTPSLLWWRLYEPLLAAHWSTPPFDAGSLQHEWHRLFTLPGPALERVANNVLSLASGALTPSRGCLPRTLPAAVTDAIRRAAGDDAGAVYLIACTGSAASALVRLRFSPRCSAEGLERCRAALGEADLRLGSALLAAQLVAPPRTQAAAPVAAHAR